jgi:hypothetical protein
VNSDISAWSFHASIFSFAAPCMLFVAVAATLLIVFTDPAAFPRPRSGTPGDNR